MGDWWDEDYLDYNYVPGDMSTEEFRRLTSGQGLDRKEVQARHPVSCSG